MNEGKALEFSSYAGSSFNLRRLTKSARCGYIYAFFGSNSRSGRGSGHSSMVEYRLPKPGVVGSSPIARSLLPNLIPGYLLTMKNWHLLTHDRPLRGSLNMAVDEYLFRSLGPEPRTYLRFYQWERPTASLGYGQTAARVVDPEFCRAQGIDIVRRMTGGKLVLHHREVTYSVISNDVDTFTATLGGSYKLVSRALVRGLERMGLAASLAGKAPASYARGTMPCFSRPAQDEIEIKSLKIVGSAQKRTGERFLQHGSIPLAHDEELLKAVSLYKTEGGILMTSLGRELGGDITFDWAVERLTAGFAEFFAAALPPLALSEAAWAEIGVLETNKYANPRWTFEAMESA
jgi:lipoyl(octanoyl) transferase